LKGTIPNDSEGHFSYVKVFGIYYTVHYRSCSAVYCNQSCLWVCVCVCGSVTTITRNCMHRS